MAIGITMGVWSSSFINAIATTYVSSVQQVSIILNSTTGTSANATIAAVDTSRAFIYYQGITTDEAGGNAAQFQKARVTLLNGTTVVANRFATDAAETLTVNATIIQPTSALVDFVQYGSITMGTLISANATITSAAASRTAIAYLGNSLDIGNNNSTTCDVRVFAASPTIVVGNSNTSATDANIVNFVAISYNPSVISNLQQQTTVYTNASTAVIGTTITSAATANSIIINGNFRSNGAGFGRSKIYYSLPTAVTANSTRSLTTATTLGISRTIVTFVPGVLKTVQRGTISLNGVTSANTAITGVNPNKAAANYLGFNTPDAAAIPGPAMNYCRLTLVGSAAVAGLSAATSAFDRNLGYQVEEYN